MVNQQHVSEPAAVQSATESESEDEYVCFDWLELYPLLLSW